MGKSGNIYTRLSAARKKEEFRVLARGSNFKVERIVSCGQVTPKNKWLCQKQAEWVMVLKGRARLMFKYGKRKLLLKTGDYIFIPPYVRHRVDWTHPRQITLWLAVHLNKP